MKNKENQSMIDDMVAMLDSLMESGTGHVDISVQRQADADGVSKQVCTLKTMECRPDMACSVPTLMEGLDGEEEKGELYEEQSGADR